MSQNEKRQKSESTQYQTKNKKTKNRVRRKQITKGRKTYEYWEGRVTVGYDEKGKQIVRSVSGKTEKEAQAEVNKILFEVQQGSYIQTNNITVGAWMTKWCNECLNHTAEGTAHEYRQKAKTYIIPALGSIKLQKLTPMQIQGFVNKLSKPKELGGNGLSPKYVKDIHGVLHKALETAISMKLLSSNPSDNCSLPKLAAIPRKKYDIEDLKAFIMEINNHIHERYYLLLLMTGMREAEPLGLTWDCIDYKNRIIHVKQQLQRNRDTGEYKLVVPKAEEIRDLPMGDELFALLKEQQTHEKKKRAVCGDCWQGKNLVFSNSTGGYLSYRTVFDCYKRIVKKIGLPEMRVHDLRHAYTMLALSNGDDVKTVQTLLGHKTPEFTMKVYANSPNSIKKESASRMDNTIRTLREVDEENNTQK